MSDEQNCRTRDFSEYDAMTTEELEQILRLDAEAPEGQASDGELLLYVMEVLAKRRKNSDNPGKTALESWESFQQHYLPEEDACTPQIHKENKTTKPVNPWLRRLTAAAAVVALVVCLSISANAFSWEEMFHAVAQWAKETFSFSTDQNPQTTEPATEDVHQYATFQDLLDEAGQVVDVPTWIPEEYVLVDVRVDENPMQKTYIARYDKGDARMRISVKSFVEADPEKVEINGDFLEIYEASGMEFHIYKNEQSYRAAWIKDSYECYISGDLTIEEIKMMIDSIGKG